MEIAIFIRLISTNGLIHYTQHQPSLKPQLGSTITISSYIFWSGLNYIDYSTTMRIIDMVPPMSHCYC